MEGGKGLHIQALPRTRTTRIAGHAINRAPAGTKTLGSLGGFFAWVGDIDSSASALPAPSVSFIICEPK